MFVCGGVDFDRMTNLGQPRRCPDHEEQCQPANELPDELPDEIPGEFHNEKGNAHIHELQPKRGLRISRSRPSGLGLLGEPLDVVSNTGFDVPKGDIAANGPEFTEISLGKALILTL